MRLREQELVETRPKSGTYVSKISMERAENACFLREKLERSVLIKCCSAATPEQKQRLEQILAESESLDHSETRRFLIWTTCSMRRVLRLPAVTCCGIG